MDSKSSGAAGQGDGVAGFDTQLARQGRTGVPGQAGLEHDGLGWRVGNGVAQGGLDVGPVGVDGVGQQMAYWFDLLGVAVDEDEGDAAGGPWYGAWIRRRRGRGEGRRPRSMRSASGGLARRARRPAGSSGAWSTSNSSSGRRVARSAASVAFQWIRRMRGMSGTTAQMETESRTDRVGLAAAEPREPVVDGNRDQPGDHMYGC